MKKMIYILVLIGVVSLCRFSSDEVKAATRNEVIENDEFINKDQIVYYNDYCWDLDIVYEYLEGNTQISLNDIYSSELIISYSNNEWYLNNVEMEGNIPFPWRDISSDCLKFYTIEGNDSNGNITYNYYYFDCITDEIIQLNYYIEEGIYVESVYDVYRADVYNLFFNIERTYEIHYNSTDLNLILSTYYGENISNVLYREIENAYYLENLNENYPVNIDGTCLLVSLMQILSFYNYFSDTRLVNDDYSEHGIIYYEETLEEMDELCDDEWVLYNQSPGFNTGLKNELLDDYRSCTGKIYTGGGMYFSIVDDILQKYCDDNDIDLIHNLDELGDDLAVYVDSQNINFSPNLRNDLIISCIDRNIPVLLGFDGADYIYPFFDNTLSIVFDPLIAHAVVAYGYVELENGDVWYKVNFGMQYYNYAYVKADGYNFFAINVYNEQIKEEKKWDISCSMFGETLVTDEINEDSSIHQIVESLIRKDVTFFEGCYFINDFCNACQSYHSDRVDYYQPTMNTNNLSHDCSAAGCFYQESEHEFQMLICEDRDGPVGYAYYCTICGFLYDHGPSLDSNHMPIEYDEVRHWRVCPCGEYNINSYHNMSYIKFTHNYICSGCPFTSSYWFDTGQVTSLETDEDILKIKETINMYNCLYVENNYCEEEENLDV